ncbi:MAG: hypothetical protein AAGD28_14795 [Bacteroidota bacterium]
MKSYATYVLSILLLFACEEADFSKVCEVNDPAMELVWLKELIEDRQDSLLGEVSYFSFIYEDKLYITDAYCGNKFLQWLPSFYDCQGNEITFESEDFQKINLLERKLLWKGTACD